MSSMLISECVLKIYACYTIYQNFINHLWLIQSSYFCLLLWLMVLYIHLPNALLLIHLEHVRLLHELLGYMGITELFSIVAITILPAYQ